VERYRLISYAEFQKLLIREVNRGPFPIQAGWNGRKFRKGGKGTRNTATTVSGLRGVQNQGIRKDKRREVYLRNIVAALKRLN